MKTPTSECKAKNPDTCYYHGSNATVNSLKREAVQLVKSGDISEALKILGKVKELENSNKVSDEESVNSGGVTDPHGTTRWHNRDGMLHRVGVPAVIYKNGKEEYWQNGNLHRDGVPAVIHADGDKEWWQNGKLHRDDAPAIMRADGHKEWYQNDKLHRVDGPAVIYADGGLEWWVNGKQHRVDGPAVILPNGREEYWVNGSRVQ